MKKSFLLGVGAAALLSACSFGGSATETFEYTADDKEGTVTLLNEFFESTLKNTNMVVTVKVNGQLQLTETLEGDKSSAVYPGSTTSYTYVKDGKYYYAVDSGDSKYYMEDKNLYDNGRYVFKVFTLLTADFPEGATYACSYKGEGTLGEKEEDYKGAATFTLDLAEGTNTVKINARSKNKLVENYEIDSTMVQDGQTVSSKYTLSFIYGSASVKLPDFSSWTDAIQQDE